VTPASLLLWVVIGYLCGSIPFGVVMARMRGVDIRKTGSGNIGATNVGRVLGRRWGIACFILDGLKGFLPVLLAGIISGPLRANESFTAAALGAWMLVMAATVVGHMAPLFLGFRGGKGVATGFGACLGVWPVLTIPIAAALIVWILTLRIGRMVSLASIASAIALPILVVIWSLAPTDIRWSVPLATAWPACVIAFLLCAFVIWRHRTNLLRIREGTEPRIGRTSASQVP